MKKSVFIVLIVAILVAIGVFASNSESDNNSNDNQNQIANSTTESNSDSGNYIDYSPDVLENLSTEKTVLFFRADWCLTCRILDNDITENLDSIPSDLTIVKANFDRETELKKQYRVATQHTLVVLDDDGNELQKWTGILSLDSLLETIDS